ncbi:hypothetical protein [Sphingomonas colocasiae]|uniref:Uncharacterized protein n=1 Tax=Sphingomonas colocasiae TaxID=1848973 RepID=A0ABS7PYQ1_9SPHN|nr:hypothetical protein [Sphingomonas colocasiae]MBY8826084.1 hypothetical protein [Sphingomonas colocasiae]
MHNLAYELADLIDQRGMRERAEPAVAAVHEIVKGHAMTMPTAIEAACVGIVVAENILREAIEFAVRSAEASGAEADAIRAAIELVFAGMRP